MLHPIAIAVIFAALSGIVGMAGVLAPFRLRLRSLEALSVRTTLVGSLADGAGVGVMSFTVCWERPTQPNVALLRVRHK